MKHLYPYLRRFRKESILAPLFKMLEATFDLLVPMVVADIIKVGIAGGDTTYIWTRCGLLVLMALIGLLCSFTAQYFAARAAIGTSTGLRHELMAHIQSLSFSELDTLGVSTLITRMTSDVNQVQNGLNMFLRLFLRSPFIVAGAMIAAFTIDTQIALIFLAAIPVLAVIVFGIMRITSPMYKTVQSRLDAVTGATRENLSGVRVVRAFGREDAEEENFVQQKGSLNAMQLKVGRIAALMNPLTYVVVNLGIIGILYFGANKIGSGALLSGDVVALVNYMSQILVELVKLANLVVLLTRAIASMGRVSQVLDTPSTMTFPEKPVSADAASDVAVAFEHVSLRYQGAGAESLSDVTFTAKKGQTIGVIGGTGSGKTTLVGLIPRFYDASSGTIRVDGRNVNSYSLEELREKVHVVLQRAVLFRGTLRENLLWGNKNANDEEMQAAVKAAQAADFVQSKGGLDMKITAEGRNLSGGQRQRLSIARALVGNPEILILDDSASALDYVTEKALRGALSALPNKPTVFIVSQRTSSLRHADKILVLDNGALVGCGTHDALLENCSVYREIYDSQFGGKEAAAK